VAIILEEIRVLYAGYKETAIESHWIERAAETLGKKQLPDGPINANPINREPLEGRTGRAAG